MADRMDKVNYTDIDFTNDEISCSSYVIGRDGDRKAEVLRLKMPPKYLACVFVIEFTKADSSGYRSLPLEYSTDLIEYEIPDQVLMVGDLNISITAVSTFEGYQKRLFERKFVVATGLNPDSESPSYIDYTELAEMVEHLEEQLDTDISEINAAIEAEADARCEADSQIDEKLENIPVEIWKSDSTAKYTAQELSYLADQKKHFTYKGLPVLSTGYLLVPREFYFTYVKIKATSEMDIVQYVAKCKVVNSTITEGTVRTFPYKVNHQVTDTNGEITLYAENIKGGTGYVPTNDEDIATKKYVDDNSASDWEEIGNKPESFPPSSHTHSYNELDDKPDIPNIPDGINVGDIPYWNGSAWTVGDISNIVEDADNKQY